MDFQEEEQTQKIRDHFNLLVKHKWLIIFLLIVSVSLTLVHISRIIPVYNATLTLIIGSERSTSPLTGQQMDLENFFAQSVDFNTHLKLFTSRPVLKTVIKELKLDQSVNDNPDQNPSNSILSVIKANIRLLLRLEEKPLHPDEKLDRLLEMLRKKISIREVRDTRLLKVSATHYDPVWAADIANKTGQAYIEFNASTRLKSSRNIMNWMTGQLYEMKKKLEEAEREFVEYKQNEKLFSIEGRQNVITKKIEDFNEAYLEVRNQRLEAETVLSELKRTLHLKGNITKARSLINNPRIDSLYTQLLELEVEEIRLGKVFKLKHPKMKQIRSRIDETRAKVDDEITKEIENLKSQHSILFSKEKALQDTISGFENDALDTNKKELKYSILKRDVDMNQNLYNTLLTKIKETNIVDDLDVVNIRVVEEATPPLKPVDPHKKRKLFLGIIIGLMFGMGISFFIEYLDQTIHTEEDVKKYLDLPVLSVIPLTENGED